MAGIERKCINIGKTLLFRKLFAAMVSHNYEKCNRQYKRCTYSKCATWKSTDHKLFSCIFLRSLFHSSQRVGNNALQFLMFVKSDEISWHRHMCAFDGQRMGLCVEYPLIKWQYRVIRKEQVQVFKCFCEEEALLNIILGRVQLIHVSDARIAALSFAPFL